MEILQSINLGNTLINLGMLIIAIIAAYQVAKKSQRETIESKADKVYVKEISEEVKSKASTMYVDKEIRGVHHRIDESSAHINKSIDLLIYNQSEMQKDIKEILKKI